jgi:diadenosine tetraphosphate (Ap4A) HIT family hydrolase
VFLRTSGRCINSGEAAGKTVMHCHVHLIPRRTGELSDPRGGVRAVVPGRADYTLNAMESRSGILPTPSCAAPPESGAEAVRSR